MRPATEIGTIDILETTEIIVPFHPGNDRHLGVLDENTRLFIRPGQYLVFDSEVGGTFASVDCLDEEGLECTYRIGFGLNDTSKALVSSFLGYDHPVNLNPGFALATFKLTSGRVACRIEKHGEPLH